MNQTWTAHIKSTRSDETYVRFNSRQNAIDYILCFDVRLMSRPTVSIIVDRGTPFERILYPPNF